MTVLLFILLASLFPSPLQMQITFKCLQFTSHLSFQSHVHWINLILHRHLKLVYNFCSVYAHAFVLFSWFLRGTHLGLQERSSAPWSSTSKSVRNSGNYSVVGGLPSFQRLNWVITGGMSSLLTLQSGYPPGSRSSFMVVRTPAPSFRTTVSALLVFDYYYYYYFF